MNAIEYILQLNIPRKMQVGGIVYTPRTKRSKYDDFNTKLNAFVSEDFEDDLPTYISYEHPEENIEWEELLAEDDEPVTESTSPIDVLMPGVKPVILRTSSTPVSDATSSAPITTTLVGSETPSSKTKSEPTSYKRGVTANSGLKAYSRKDFSRSAKATRLKIDNSIPEEYYERIDLMVDILNDLQNAWGSPIRLTSGYRSPTLNSKLDGSSKSSLHMQGYAMDMVPANGKINEFMKFVKEWAKDKNYDQILFETNKRGSKWVHFGLYNNAGKQRHQMKELYA